MGVDITENEALVWRALVKINETSNSATPQDVIKETGPSRKDVDESIEGLIRKGVFNSSPDDKIDFYYG